MAWKLIVIAASGVVLPAVQSPPGGGGTPQDAPPIVVVGPDADIVVTGPRPAIRGGLWQFTRSATIRHGLPVDLTDRRMAPSFQFSVCLPDGTLEDMLRDAAGERSSTPRSNKCGRLRIGIGNGKITGGRSCVAPAAMMGIDAKKNRLDISGRYDPKRLTINLASEVEFDGLERGGGPDWNPQRPQGQRWRAEAVRVGDCPSERRLDQRTREQVIDRLFDPGGSDEGIN